MMVYIGKYIFIHFAQSWISFQSSFSTIQNYRYLLK